MKYGLLVNPKNTNLGDDIQSYAESRFLPRVDVMVDREELDTFVYGDGTEPVALIMGAWFMWKKWHWPPARQIIPCNVSYHHYDRAANVIKPVKRAYALPMFTEHYDGVGGQWFKDYGPVGCRDAYTKKVLDKKGIPAYFSGCVTLTLPKQPETPDKGSYVVFVDLAPKVEQKLREMIGDRFEIRVITHTTESLGPKASWEEREKRAVEYLTLYQNAKYVVTRRLHVALPCLAMETPVMVIQSVRMNDPNRFDPYKKWLHYCRNNEFLEKGYPDFDFVGGTTRNDTSYLEYREKLIETITTFVQDCEEHAGEPLEYFDKRSFSDVECLQWRCDLMREALDNAHVEAKDIYFEYRQLATGETSGAGGFQASAVGAAARGAYRKAVQGKPIENSRIIAKIRNRLKRRR